jgi:hypothetical protein
VSTNRTTLVDVVASHALARREAGARFSDARDERVLFAPEPFELRLLVCEADEEVANERGDGAVFLGGADAGAVVEVRIDGYRNVLHSYTISQFHSNIKLEREFRGCLTRPPGAGIDLWHALHDSPGSSGTRQRDAFGFAQCCRNSSCVVVADRTLGCGQFGASASHREPEAAGEWREGQDHRIFARDPATGI